MMNEADVQQLQQLAAKAQSALTQSITPVNVNNVVEPGWTTTEFWATIGAIVVGVGALVHPGFSAPPLVQAIVGGASSISTGLYAIGRSLRKK